LDLGLGQSYYVQRNRCIFKYSNINIDNSEHCDGRPRQVKQISDENEFKDIEFEDLVMLEGP
jgi:hypothetical protein